MFWIPPPPKLHFSPLLKTTTASQITTSSNVVKLAQLVLGNTVDTGFQTDVSRPQSLFNSPYLTLCSSTLDSEPSLRWPVSHGGCGLSERRFLPLRFRACLFSRQPTASAWSPPSPKPPRAACSELSSSADTRSWTSSSIVRRKCLRLSKKEGKYNFISHQEWTTRYLKHLQALTISRVHVYWYRV